MGRHKLDAICTYVDLRLLYFENKFSTTSQAILPDTFQRTQAIIEELKGLKAFIASL